MQTHDVPKQHPFSLYDAIGYFIPGSIFIVLFLLLDFDYTGNAEIIKDFLNMIENLFNACQSSIFTSIIAFTVFLTICYTIGQLFCILSSIIIEKTHLCEHHNQLYYILLNRDYQTTKSQTCCLGNLFIFPIWIWKTLLSCIGIKNLQQDEHLDDARMTAIKGAVEKILGPLYKTEEDETKKDETKKDETKEKGFQENFFIPDRDKEPRNDYFHLIYHYVVERSTHHLHKIQNYVALYGFMKNTCMAFISFCWINIIFMALHYLSHINLKHFKVTLFFTFIYSFISFLTLYGVHKYKRRYTLEVLHAATALYRRWEEQKDLKVKLIEMKHIKPVGSKN